MHLPLVPVLIGFIFLYALLVLMNKKSHQGYVHMCILVLKFIQLHAGLSKILNLSASVFVVHVLDDEFSSDKCIWIKMWALTV